MAAGAALLAVAVLWPTPARGPLRDAATAACRALAARLRAEVAYRLSDEDGAFAHDYDRPTEKADEATDGAAARVPRDAQPPGQPEHRRASDRSPRRRARLAQRDRRPGGAPDAGRARQPSRLCGEGRRSGCARARGRSAHRRPAETPPTCKRRWPSCARLWRGSSRTPQASCRSHGQAATSRPDRRRPTGERVHQLAGSELPRAGARLCGHQHRRQHRADRRRRATQLACARARTSAAGHRRARSPLRSERGELARRAQLRVAAQQRARRGRSCACRPRRRTRPACSTRSGSCSARSRCCARTR